MPASAAEILAARREYERRLRRELVVVARLGDDASEEEITAAWATADKTNEALRHYQQLRGVLS